MSVCIPFSAASSRPTTCADELLLLRCLSAVWLIFFYSSFFFLLFPLSVVWNILSISLKIPCTTAQLGRLGAARLKKADTTQIPSQHKFICRTSQGCFVAEPADSLCSRNHRNKCLLCFKN